MWKPLNGYFWPYRIDEDANVEWLNPKTDEWVRLKPFMVRTKQGGSYGHLCVHMKTTEGRFKNVYVKSLMIDAFFGGQKEGYVFRFKNGSLMDCSLYNLERVTRDKFYKDTGGGLRRSVEKIDRHGNVLELYASVTEAAEKNFMSRRCVSDRCQGRIKHPFEIDNFTFRYERGRRRDQTIDFVPRT